MVITIFSMKTTAISVEYSHSIICLVTIKFWCSRYYAYQNSNVNYWGLRFICRPLVLLYGQ